MVPLFKPNVIPEDPEDDKFIACAIEGKAEYIVSEDKDLRRLGKYGPIQIVGKQAFLRILEGEEAVAPKGR